MESERSDALFRDLYARKLAGTCGEEIVRSMKRGRQLVWPMIVRTAVMDELILRAVNRDGVEAVLNLAAGLDTHAYRLPLPRALRWTDVDLPDMLSYKEEQLAGRAALVRARISEGRPDRRRCRDSSCWNGPNPSAIHPSHSWSLCTALPTIIVMLSLPPSSSAACSRSSHTCLADVMFPRYSPI